MKKNILTFGLISGAIISILMVISTTYFHKNPDYSGAMIWGYTSMLISFSFIVMGIINYRNKYNSGVISFGKAFQVGLMIALIASTFYVATWLVEYYCFIPDFMDKYAEHMIQQAVKKGESAEKIAKTTAEINTYKELYKNPLMVILLTYAEVLPLGFIVSLISALILKRKPKNPDLAKV